MIQKIAVLGFTNFIKMGVVTFNFSFSIVIKFRGEIRTPRLNQYMNVDDKYNCYN